MAATTLRRSVAGLLLALSLAGCNDEGAAPQATYRVVLPEPTAAVTSSVAFSINAQGMAVGTMETAAGRQAYAWSAQQVVNLGGFATGGEDGIAYNVNDAGVVIGSARFGSHRQAFAWRLGTSTALPGLDPATSYAEAYGIDPAGVVVGASGHPDAPVPVMWRDGQVRPLRVLDPAVPIGEAYGITDAGVIVGGSGTAGGYAAVMWTDPDTVVPLGRLPGAARDYGVALAVSRSRHITGVTSASGGLHAFLWKDGRMTDLGDLPGGGDHSVGYGVNRHGHVVGSSQVKPGHGAAQSAVEPALLHHAFLWTPQTGMVDLNTLIDPADPLKPRVELLETAVITDDGRITGRALVDGVIRAYILIPRSSAQ